MKLQPTIIAFFERKGDWHASPDVDLSGSPCMTDQTSCTALEDGLAAVVQKLVDRLTHEAQYEQSIKLLTTALLLSGLRVERNVALRPT